jgi:hypothetical protein
MMDEFGTTIKAILYERLANPLASMFVLAWFARNWRPVALVVFGGGEIEDRIAIVERDYVDIWENVWYPLGIALVLVVVYPILSYLPFAFWEWSKHKQLLVRTYFDTQNPLTGKQAAELKAAFRESTERYEKRISHVETELSNSRMLVSEMEKRRDELEGSVSAQKNAGRVANELRQRVEVLGRIGGQAEGSIVDLVEGAEREEDVQMMIDIASELPYLEEVGRGRYRVRRKGQEMNRMVITLRPGDDSKRKLADTYQSMRTERPDVQMELRGDMIAIWTTRFDEDANWGKKWGLELVATEVAGPDE